MPDASERIIILSAVILVIILWLPNSGLIRTSVTIDDLEVEIVTSSDTYTLGDSFTANFYLVNHRTKDVWLEPDYSLSFTGVSENDPKPGPRGVNIARPRVAFHIPANSKAQILHLSFKPQYSGEFFISCLGANKTVLILEPVKMIGVGSMDMFDILDPILALSHGFKGYINVSYVSEMPARVIVSPGKVIHFTIRLELIPHVPEFTEAEVVLDPENASGFGVGWGDPVPIFNNYIRYSPNGTILVRVDEPRNVTMILSVPEGLSGMSAYPRHLLGVGIMADVPVVSADR